MTARVFVPWVEQLESRVLLAVMADVMPWAAAQSEFVEAAAVATYNNVEDKFNVAVRNEDTASGQVLVVVFKNLDQPRTVGIVGGELARTAPDGTVRLRQPPNVRTLELTISDDNDVQHSFLHVELDPFGRVLSHSPIVTTMDSTADHNTFLGTVDQLSRLHGNTPHNMLSAANSTSATGIASESHAMDPRTIDEAILHLGMPSMAAMPQYNAMSSHGATMRDDSAETQAVAEADSPNDHDVAEDETSPIQMAMARIEEPHAADDIENEDVVELEIEDVETVDAALVSWVNEEIRPAAEQARLIAASNRSENEPTVAKQAIHEVAMTVRRPIELPKIVRTAESATDGSTNSLIPCISGVVLAIVCAAGVFVLEQRAAKKLDVAII